jgi:transcriptional regulator with XRE-family HTH domain
MGVAETFPGLCRQWRNTRNLSQLALAETAGISQRHVSWLETGRSKPSRDMVLRLAEALDVPLRERNTLLTAAGFAPQYRESSLDEPHMAAVDHALRKVLDHHDPFPAMVIDRRWRRVMGNRGSDLMMTLAGAPPVGAGAEPFNLAEATLAEDGLRRFIRNADEVIPLFVHRLRSEAQAQGDPAGIAYVEALIRRSNLNSDSRALAEPLLPVLPLKLSIDDIELSMFTVISTFGTPQDITTDELRIEAFYPVDEATRLFFEGAFGQ